MSLKLEALPVSFNGWISFYPVREQSETRRQPVPRRDPDPQGAPFDDDIPFAFAFATPLGSILAGLVLAGLVIAV